VMDMDYFLFTRYIICTILKVLGIAKTQSNDWLGYQNPIFQCGLIKLIQSINANGKPKDVKD
jgi:hypothetical protein